MERHLSVGVATIVALMQAHRAWGRGDAPQNNNERADIVYTDHPEADDETPPDGRTRH
ncbi:MAG TPA: hypothetical protein VFG62_13970 [Rhodopila sp.]|jgi:hypothetical protein|nr:hypothetical protein [Rhodopila sp.]